MLNRRQLRIKVLQALYAFVFSENDNLMNGEKELLNSIGKTKELFVWQISIAEELANLISQKLDDRTRKFLPTEQDLNPNYKFVENKIISQWKDNRDIQRLINYYKVSWIENLEAFRRLAYNFENSEQYKQYLNSESSYENDKAILVCLYNDFVYEDDFFIDFYETKSIYWYTDFCMMNFFITKFIEDYKLSYDEFCTLQQMHNDGEESANDFDKDFAITLFSKVIIHRNEYTQIVNDFTKNWDPERISAMDVLIIIMAITEILNFPSIPARVTLNEYIDIAKIFSTPKSNYFVNGVLDSIYNDLLKSGKVNKTGRGLINK
ncbi:transcription antitermination factor NusB [Bacteroidales bacterium OttesenSCG-928-K03]|nr:transcription antitermination factor NusB [Odoribacter sp. OttesenSCG-928-L07]MDL2242639.1 transcription antitermination factor NusB [Bacteroidales bacterium OttesenSCG-928-K03]